MILYYWSCLIHVFIVSNLRSISAGRFHPRASFGAPMESWARNRSQEVKVPRGSQWNLRGSHGRTLCLKVRSKMSPRRYCNMENAPFQPWKRWAMLINQILFWKYMSFSGKTDMWERSWKYHPDMLLMESWRMMKWWPMNCVVFFNCWSWTTVVWNALDGWPSIILLVITCIQLALGVRYKIPCKQL